jgi:uncharacterized membrane protein YbhN (UPF0104 family)
VKRATLSKLLPSIVGVVALAAAVIVVVRDRHQLADAVHRLGWPIIGASFALGLAGMFFIALLWRAVLLGLGAPAEVAISCRVFFISQLGKYLPGSVWPVVSQMEFGARRGIARRTMLSANVITLALSLMAGLALAAALLPFSSPDALGRFWWTFLLLPPLLACIHPRALPAVLDRMFGLVKREPLNERLTGRSIASALLWATLSWVLLGLHLYVVTHALGAHGAQALAAAVGGMAFAVAVGVIFVPAPAGAGIRDVALVAALSTVLGATDALAAALASRVLLVVVDLVLASLGAVIRPHGAVPAPEPAQTAG